MLARGEKLLVVRLVVAGGLEDQRLVVALGRHPSLGEIIGVAAELDVGAAAGHVRRDGDRTQLARLRDDLRFLVVELGIEDVVLDAALGKQLGDVLGLVNGHRAHQHRLPFLVAGDDLFDDCAVFAFGRFVNEVVVVLADHRPVGRDLHDVERVNFAELVLFCQRRAGHAGELFIQTEVILEGDGRLRLVLALDLHALLGLDGLVQSVGVAAAEHNAAGEGIDDEHLPVPDDVIHVALHDAVGTDGVVDVVHISVVFRIGQVFQPEVRLRLAGARGGQHGVARLLVDDVVGVGAHLGVVLF